MLGPGNQYVTAAKMLLQNSEAMISMDMPAGPSEVLVIADQGAPHAHVAADLLSQAEHGPDSQVMCCLHLPALFPSHYVVSGGFLAVSPLTLQLVVGVVPAQSGHDMPAGV